MIRNLTSLALVAVAAIVSGDASLGQTTGPATDCCGLPPLHDPSEKSMVGTAVDANASPVYFTGYRGELSEVYYPTVDTLATANMEFLVGDRAKTFLDEEKTQTWSVTQPDKRSMRWQAVTANDEHDWRITKTIFADPSNATVVQRTTFEARNGKAVGDFNLYLLYKPYLNNQAANNNAVTAASSGQTYLVSRSGDGSKVSALGSSLGWRVENGVTMVSNGYSGANDGWQDLFKNNVKPFSMRYAFESAANGNVAQTGWLDTARVRAAKLSFDVVLGFGATQESAIAAASTTLGEDLGAQQTLYDNAWHGYTAALSTQNGAADDQYYLAAMTLKTSQDKSSGAMIAGIGTPWGFAEGDSDIGGYHVVWSRDMYKFANALITAGDNASAASAVNWLFNVDMNPSNGRFPQNAFVNGTPDWPGTQLDEQGMPIVLAYRLGPSVYNPLWPKIQLTANFIYASGPWTQQERWEESGGYSPSTIAAEIAGLVDAAQIALENNDAPDAAKWLRAADYWQQNVSRWTYTTHGCPDISSNCGGVGMYMRINPSPAQGGFPPASWNPISGPDPSLSIVIGNNGGTHRAIDIIDGGFLELVRMGVMAPDDPTIISSLSAYDSVIKQTINGYPAWYRYNFDGYGETNAGLPYDNASGRGRLWPIFDAERGNYLIAVTGAGTAGAAYLSALKAFSTPQGFIPEQIWNPTITLPGVIGTPEGWVISEPANQAPGSPTGSMEPLNWAEGEYINLLADIAANRVIDIPAAVCSRYHACVIAPNPGQVEVDISAKAETTPGQYLYVAGNTAALGTWNTDLALPLDSATYPVWKNSVNVDAGSALQYKYYRKNGDGSVTWECYPGNGQCNGNRSLALPAFGQASVTDTASWN